jgi:hypothetical protein
MDTIRVVEPAERLAPGWREQWGRALDDCWSAGQMVIAFLAAAIVFGPSGPVAPIFTPQTAAFGSPADRTTGPDDSPGPRVAVTMDLRPQAADPAEPAR